LESAFDGGLPGPGKMTVDNLLRSFSLAFSTRVLTRVDGDWGVVLREGLLEFTAEPVSTAPFAGLRSEFEVVFGRGISPRISETDLCLIAPEATRVVIRSGTTMGVAAGVEGVRRGVDEGVTEGFFEVLVDFSGDSAVASTGEVPALLSSVVLLLSKESLIVLSTSIFLGEASSSASESATSG
jgi:hypothetical protein